MAKAKTRNMAVPVKTAEALDKYCAQHLVDTGNKITAVNTIAAMTDELIDRRLIRAEAACLRIYQFFPEGGLKVGAAGRPAWGIGKKIHERQETERSGVANYSPIDQRLISKMGKLVGYILRLPTDREVGCYEIENVRTKKYHSFISYKDAEEFIDAKILIETKG